MNKKLRKKAFYRNKIFRDLIINCFQKKKINYGLELKILKTLLMEIISIKRRNK
jgi:hypothetical protein